MFKIELSEQHLNIIIEALGNTAYRLSAPVLAEIGKQVQEQRPPQPSLQQPQGNGKTVSPSISPK